MEKVNLNTVTWRVGGMKVDVNWRGARVFCAGDGVLSFDGGLHYTDTHISQNLPNMYTEFMHVIQNITGCKWKIKNKTLGS